MSIPSITALPTIPVIGSATFEDDVNAFFTALKDTFVGELNATITAINSAIVGSGWTVRIVAVGDSPVSVASGDLLLVDTSGGQVTLEFAAAPGSGDFCKVMDMKETFGTNKCILDGNGNNVNGSATLDLDQSGWNLDCVYDTTYKWAAV